MRIFYLLLFIFVSTIAIAQNGKISGKVTEAGTGKVVDLATVAIENSTIATTTNEEGIFELTALSPGIYNLKISSVGYISKTIFEIEVSNSKPVQVAIEIEQSVQNLKEVEVKASAFAKKSESPISMRTIGMNEIQRYPGGNRDISKVIQALPGVGFSTAFRNDIIIRGGSPAENRFYLDDIEIPNINHFSTQGASGGPVGMINVDFIRDVNFYSSAFPSDRGNTLSSLMDIRMRNGRSDRWGGTVTLGSSELSLSMESPLNKKKNATILASVRYSYLQWLFSALKLPFLPSYSDAQFKINYKPTTKDEITVLGLMACDIFKLNKKANETESQKYLLSVLPVQNQWSYMIGAKYQHNFKESFLQVVLSRNELINKVYKYQNNDESKLKTTDYTSTEAENKFRLEWTGRPNGWKINTGVNLEYARYFNKSALLLPFGNIKYETTLNLFKYGLFLHVSKLVADDRVSIAFGARADGNTYNKSMANLLNQISPRASISVNIIKNLKWNANIGYYHQLPAYTVLGYKDTVGNYANQNRTTYMRNIHIVTGLEYTTKINSRISVEGFYKQYFNVPFLLKDSVSIVNLGANYFVIGNEPAASVNKGRTYGAEFLYEQKLYKGWYGIVSYTIFWSQFQDKQNHFVSSAWDTRHIISLTAGKKFKRNWEIGARFRTQGGQPYTPYNQQYSALKYVYDLNPSGYYDYSQINSQRLPWFHQLDVRVTKKWYFKKWSFELYLDLQNAYFHKQQQQSILVLDRDANGNAQTDPSDPTRYKMKYLTNKTGTLLPTLGFVIYY